MENMWVLYPAYDSSDCFGVVIMYRTNFDFVVEKAKTAEKPLRVVIAGADAENILKGAFRAEADGFAELTLLGDEEKITVMLSDLGLADRKYTIVNAADPDTVVQAAVDLVKAGKADALMRGSTQTRDFLLPVLDKKNGLMIPGRLLTHINLLKLPDYDRILGISDVTIIPAPDMSQRKEVVRNLTETLQRLGYEKPNIALLSLVEKPIFRMPRTVEAQTIVREHEAHPIASCNLVGPIAYDLVLSKEAARLKHYDCPYCGEFDGIVVPRLNTGNLLVKALHIHAHAQSCGVIVGANIPIAITSRADPPEEAYLSLAMCVALPARMVS